eukprot:gene20437-27225_t
MALPSSMSGASGSTAPGSLFTLRKMCGGCNLEAHGAEGALIANRQSQWLTMVEPLLYSLMATLLDKKRDTHIIILVTEHEEKRPYFKVQHYNVMPVYAVAVELPPQFTPVVQDAVHTLKMSCQHADYAYGFILIVCSNDSRLPVINKNLSSPDLEIPYLHVDDIMRIINEEH